MICFKFSAVFSIPIFPTAISYKEQTKFNSQHFCPKMNNVSLPSQLQIFHFQASLWPSLNFYDDFPNNDFSQFNSLHFLQRKCIFILSGSLVISWNMDKNIIVPLLPRSPYEGVTHCLPTFVYTRGFTHIPWTYIIVD